MIIIILIGLCIFFPHTLYNFIFSPLPHSSSRHASDRGPADRHGDAGTSDERDVSCQQQPARGRRHLAHGLAPPHPGDLLAQRAPGRGQAGRLGRHRHHQCHEGRQRQAAAVSRPERGHRRSADGHRHN